MDLPRASRRGFLGAACATATILLSRRGLAAQTPAARKPNIIYILADDLGYGDISCLNPKSKIPTLNIDRIAAEGIRFTDAHSSSAVCTPTRYGILTGRYCWRSSLKKSVLGGLSRPLIEQGRLTVPSLLKKHGYQTACIGKWHLGIDWPLKEGGVAEEDKAGWKVDYTKPIANGPTSLGFDYFYGISASLDMPPYIFIENDRCQGVPTVEKKWIRQGPAEKDFEAIDVLPTLTRKAAAYIDQHAESSKAGQPFFIYLALTAPHTPIVPIPAVSGKTPLGPYGDFVVQVDQTVGEVIKALDRNGLTGDTLIIFTADNGCSPAAGVKDLEAKGHYPSGVFRGYKADIWDGGHHVPFIVRWPGQIKPGSASPETICLNDLMATCAAIIDDKLPDNAGEDSDSILPALLGEKLDRPLREATVHHSINGQFAIRQGKWKLVLCKGSGGWSKGGTEASDPPGQLYDMSADESERENLYVKHPDIVQRFTALLEKYRIEGGSRRNWRALPR